MPWSHLLAFFHFLLKSLALTFLAFESTVIDLGTMALLLYGLYHIVVVMVWRYII